MGSGILDPAVHDARGMCERELVRILRSRAGRSVQEVSHGVVCQHQPFDLLFPHCRGLGAGSVGGPASTAGPRRMSIRYPRARGLARLGQVPMRGPS